LLLSAGVPVDDELEAVIGANRSFYEAFEARDLDAMSQAWEHSDRATCTHPGWPTLRGWAKVAASFFALFQNDQRLQFILTEVHADAAGDVAWVSLDENVLDVDAGLAVAAVNLFARDDDGHWRMIVHHASVITAPATLDRDGPS
jgi:ketosteroid isomerase-like protein